LADALSMMPNKEGPDVFWVLIYFPCVGNV
jgi:hypothetical protein